MANTTWESYLTSLKCEACITDKNLCDMCMDNPKYANVPKVSLFQTRIYKLKRQYTPTCPRGYTDCVCDPAYIQAYHPKEYNELYGDKTPEEAVIETCVKQMSVDPHDQFSCYESTDLLG